MVADHIEAHRSTPRSIPHPTTRTRNGPPQPAPKVTYFAPVRPHLARNTIIESTFDVGRRFRCTMRVIAARSIPAR
jgi:hypothetical protein